MSQDVVSIGQVLCYNQTTTNLGEAFMIKIEKKGPQSRNNEFIDTIKKLQVGESFLYELTNYNRTILSIAGPLLDRVFMTSAEGEAHRVYRVT
jgi:hypothetical protein